MTDTVNVILPREVAEAITRYKQGVTREQALHEQTPFWIVPWLAVVKVDPRVIAACREALENETPELISGVDEALANLTIRTEGKDQ